MSECSIVHSVSTFADFMYHMAINPTSNGVVILIEEWNDLLQNIIPSLHKRYPEFTFGV